jgi:hypothetical protein
MNEVAVVRAEYGCKPSIAAADMNDKPAFDP